MQVAAELWPVDIVVLACRLMRNALSMSLAFVPLARHAERVAKGGSDAGIENGKSHTFRMGMIN